jgi:hypothetical protein
LAEDPSPHFRKVANYVMLHKAWVLDGLLEWPSLVAKQRRRESVNSLLPASVCPTEIIENVFHMLLIFNVKIK